MRILAFKRLRDFAALLVCSVTLGQTPGTITKIHHVADFNRAVAFYRAMGLTPRGDATYSIPGESFTLELTKSANASRESLMQDFGATRLVLSVRDVDLSLAAAKRAGARILTPGGEPLPFPTGGRVTRGVAVRDPGGFIVELVQFDPPAATNAPAGSNVIGGRIALTVADVAKSVDFYRALGFEINAPTAFRPSENVMKMFDIPGTRWRYAMGNLPGSPTQWELAEFEIAARKPSASAGPNAPSFAIVRPGGSAVKEVRDPDGVILKLVGPK